MLVIFGMAYTFAAFFPALSTEFGATRGQTAIVFSLSGFIYFGIGAFSGLLADRIGPRPVILAGILLVAAALALTAFAGALWQIYLLYGLGLGIGVGLAYVPAIAGSCAGEGSPPASPSPASASARCWRRPSPAG
jgi:MFS family permease